MAGLALISILCSNAVLAGPVGALKKGHIRNDKGEKCWYVQVIKENNTYFHGSLKGAKEPLHNPNFRQIRACNLLI